MVLLGASLWRHAFHANPHIVGTSIKVGGRFSTVVGVLPTSFQFPPAVQVWTPMHLAPNQHESVGVVARLAPGVSLAQARAELDTFAGPLQRALPAGQKVQPLAMAPLSYGLVPPGLRHWVWLMFGAGIIVLLLACVNVANLQLVQTLKRRHELALRSALGSSRLRLVGGALAESLIVGMAALVPAFAITWGGMRWLRAAWLSIHPGSIPYVSGIDGSVVAFAVIVAVLVTTLAAVIPAWRAAHANLGDALRDGSKGSSGGMARVTKGLVIVEIALTVVLLVGSGTFVRGLDRLLAQPVAGAAQASHVMTARVVWPGTTYQSAGQRVQFLDKVVRRLRHTSGVISATAANTIPSATRGSEIYVGRLGHPRPAQGWPVAALGIAGPDFLGTYDIKLLRGRFFAARDRAGSKPVAVVDERMAARFWPHGDALGHQMTLHPGTSKARTVTVVGVIQTLQVAGGLSTPVPSILVPLDQAAVPGYLNVSELAVRVHGNAVAYASKLTTAVHAVDPAVATREVHTQATAISRSRAGLTVLADAFGFLGLVALLLAAAGLYGILAFSVAQRTREIGVRRAIGASSAAIARTVGKTLVWQLGIGLLIGVALAIPWSGMLWLPRSCARTRMTRACSFRSWCW